MQDRRPICRDRLQFLLCTCTTESMAAKPPEMPEDVVARVGQKALGMELHAVERMLAVSMPMISRQPPGFSLQAVIEIFGSVSGWITRL